jgi:hypothetical protein
VAHRRRGQVDYLFGASAPIRRRKNDDDATDEEETGSKVKLDDLRTFGFHRLGVASRHTCTKAQMSTLKVRANVLVTLSE